MKLLKDCTDIVIFERKISYEMNYEGKNWNKSDFFFYLILKWNKWNYFPTFSWNFFHKFLDTNEGVHVLRGDSPKSAALNYS